MGYKEILKKENHLAVKEKIFKAEIMEEKEPTKEKILKVEKLAEEEITKKKIPKIEKMMSAKKIKKKVIAENFTSTNETKDIINIENNRNLGIWNRKNTKSPEQKQNNTENSECKQCNKKFISKGRLGIHEAMCKGKTIVTKDSRDIKKTTYTSLTHKETTKVKKTEENIENKTPEIKIEKNEPLELKNTRMKAENKFNKIPEIKNEKDNEIKNTKVKPKKKLKKKKKKIKKSPEKKKKKKKKKS